MGGWALQTILIAGGLAAVGVCLAPALRHLRVSNRSIKWTLAAHAALIAALGLAVAPPGDTRGKTPSQPMKVDLYVYEPPEREKPKPMPLMDQTEPMYVQPKKVELTPEELPRENLSDSMTARLLQSSTRAMRSDSRSLLAPTPGRVGASERARIERQRQGNPGDTTLAAEPTGKLAPQLGDNAPLPTYRASVGNSPVLRPTASTTGSAQAAPAAPGTDGSDTQAAALPEGANLEGEVSGRALSKVPDPPSGKGSDGGSVKLQFEVKPNGQVYNVVVKVKPGSPQLERLAKKWVQKLRFAPLPESAEQKTQSGEITVLFKKE